MLIRSLFEQALQTNPALKFAVLTGCMRISKESIFTGLNNLRVLSVSDVEFDEYFGFTDQEVRELLEYYDLGEHYDKIRSWYNGYQFGAAGVYCPWDVICCCRKLSTIPDFQPQNYWINTSSNDVVRNFVRRDDSKSLQAEIETLIAGETVTKTIRPELTYRDMYASIDNIWSVLYTTGYLTSRGQANGNTLALAIPNMEIRSIFTSQIMEFFKENAEKDGETLQTFCNALREGDSAEVERCFSGYLKKTISIRDTFVQNRLKENFYHRILVGLLGFKKTWIVRSNREDGEGYSDIVAEVPEKQLRIIIEVKYSEGGSVEQDCQAALEQINGKCYADQFYDDARKISILNDRSKKWFFYHKGGEYRKWYGNMTLVVNWENGGFEIVNFRDDKGKQRSRSQNIHYYLQEGFTWTALTAADFNVRYMPEGGIFDAKGSSGFCNEKNNLKYVIGLCNSKVSMEFLSFLAPTMDYSAGAVGKVPIIICEEKKNEISDIVTINIEISKADWDSFETSWDFQHRPLLRKAPSIAGAFEHWQSECDDRFNRLKANEEELNRIFIGIYGLRDELMPEVEDKDVTVRKADLSRDIRSFISCAVGCMFGRYSLDMDGLAYAGGEWNASKYASFAADKDNIIPICDDEYFEDDIICRFVKFIEVVYGRETLEVNLKFIA